jgi:hypothetical protein
MRFLTNLYHLSAIQHTVNFFDLDPQCNGNMHAVQDQPEHGPGVSGEPGDHDHHAGDSADHERILLQLHAQGDFRAAGVCGQHHARYRKLSDKIPVMVIMNQFFPLPLVG